MKNKDEYGTDADWSDDGEGDDDDDENILEKQD